MSTLPLAIIEPDWECKICLDGIDDRQIVLHPCGNNHTFHFGCIGEWMKQSKQCPYCRAIAPTPVPIRIALRRIITRESTCSKCNLSVKVEHMEMINCGHELHNHCALNILMRHGFNRSGILICYCCETL